MKVDSSIPAPNHIRQNPAQDVEHGGFPKILDTLAGGYEAAGGGVSSAKVAPQIGDRSASFAEKSMVLLTSVDFDSPQDIFDHDEDFVRQNISQFGHTYLLPLAPSFDEEADRIIEELREQSRLAMHVSAIAMRALASGTSPIKPLVQQSSLRVVPAATISQAAQAAQAAQTFDTAEARQSAPYEPVDAEPAPPARQSERSGSRAAIMANLFAVESGYRLVLRTPAMKAEEQSELVRRLAELFAEHGQFQPELLIFHPETTDQG